MNPFLRILLDPNPAASGGAPQTAAQINQPQTGQVDLTPGASPAADLQASATAPAAPAEPPAARTVLDGKTEAEIAAENRAAAAEARAREAETVAAEAQDKLQQLAEAQRAAAPTSKRKRGFFHIPNLLDGED